MTISSYIAGNNPDGLHPNVRAISGGYAHIRRHVCAGVLGRRHVYTGRACLLRPTLALPATCHLTTGDGDDRLLLVGSVLTSLVTADVHVTYINHMLDSSGLARHMVQKMT